MASQVEWVKWVPGTRFMVDGFAFTNPKCSHYFLTHCHSDHTVGLKRSFMGTIYCSEVSARLLAHEWGLHPPQVVVLQLGQPMEIAGATVTAIDANHCPGAVMLLFEVPQANGAGMTRILCTGDCRWQEQLYTNSCLAHKRIDTLMLDTTYALPRYTFPPQQDAINSMVQVMQQEFAKEPNCLFVVGSYHIGKERAYFGAAQALGWKVYAPPAKRKVLQLVASPEQLQLLTDDAAAAQLHVGPMASPDPVKLAASYLGKELAGRVWKRVVAFRPTGWSYKRSGELHVWRAEHAAVYGIPYSEHSSWNDLRACVSMLRPKKIIPTVNATSRAAAASIVERFIDLMDLSSSKGRIDSFLFRARGGTCQLRTAAEAAGQVGMLATAVSGNLPLALPESCVCAINSTCAADGGTLGASHGKGDAGNAEGQVSLPDGSQTQSCSLGAAHANSTPGIRNRKDLMCHSIPDADADGEQHTVGWQCVTGSSTAAGGLQLQGGSRADMVVQHEQMFEFSGVDLAQQQRLLDEAQRRLRLKHSLSLVAAKGSNKKSSGPQASSKRKRFE